jgi:hypothetical protein
MIATRFDESRYDIVTTYREAGIVDDKCFEEIRKDVKRRRGRK